MKLTDLTGKIFGRWKVIERAESKRFPSGQKQTTWRCLCECGNFGDVTLSSLKYGDSLSCGCLAIEIRTSHGKSRTRPYRIRLGMIQRCYNENTAEYPQYGGRGIKVCERWLGEHGFENFLADMGEPPSKKHTLDRIDNSLGYGPKNCRWATRLQQQRNRRANINLTIDGETLCVAEWSKKSTVHYNTIMGRIRNGWDHRLAVFGAAKSQHANK